MPWGVVSCAGVSEAYASFWHSCYMYIALAFPVSIAGDRSHPADSGRELF